MNIIQSKGRYYKEEVVRKRMRELLSQNPNGIGSEEFVVRIKEATGVSRGMIFAQIKVFQSSGLMRIERNKQDRRKATYFPNVEKVKTEQRFFEGMEFIRNLGPDLTFGEGEAKESGFRYNATIFTNQAFTKEQLTEEAIMMAKNLAVATSQIMKIQNLKIPKSFKKAVILTLEIERGVKP